MNIHKLAVSSCFLTAVLQLAKFGQDDGLAATSMYPKREEFQWRPSSILCKRFDLIDPYMGKVPTSTVYFMIVMCRSAKSYFYISIKIKPSTTILWRDVSAVEVIDFLFL